MTRKCHNCNFVFGGDQEVCPRCNTSLLVESSTPAQELLPLGVRLAGAALVLNAIALILETIFLRPQDRPAVVGPTSFIFDFIIGILLLVGFHKVLIWAQVRVALGAIVFPILYFIRGDTVQLIIQVVLSLALLGLLLGTPGKPRIVVSSLFLLGYLSLESLGIYVAVTGHNPAAMATMNLRKDIQEISGDRISGLNYAYHVKRPSATWYLRTPEVARKQNPLADRWLIRPDTDAHILIIGEQVGEGYTVDPKSFADTVLENARKVSTSFNVLEQRPLATPVQTARWIHARGTIKGMEIEYYYGLFTQDRLGFQVIGFAPTAVFPSVAQEIKDTIESFTLTTTSR